MHGRVTRIDADGCCTLVLQRPEKLNALDTATFEDLDAHLSALEGETGTIGCVVLRGAGKAFCAGADLGGIGEASATTASFKPKVIDRLSLLPQPTIAAVHGICFTGGLELALACDFIVADETARFADTHGRWGLVAGWGMMQRLPRRIGHARAKRMMMTACVVEGAEALALGLIDLLSAAGGLDGQADRLSADLLANSWFTNDATKRLLADTDALPIAAALEHERKHHPGFAPDFRDRISRFTK